MKNKIMLVILSALFISQARINSDGSVSLGAIKYYRVVSTDPTGDTGDKVCAKIGKKCFVTKL